jgi:uncharacterized membrane protein (Fun14 family)
MVAGLESLLVPVGTSFGAGAVIGYAIKKVVKIVAILIGLFIAGVAYLAYQKILIVDWKAAQSFASNTTSYIYHYGVNVMQQTASDMHDNTVITMFGVTGAGFAAGFGLGFWKG